MRTLFYTLILSLFIPTALLAMEDKACSICGVWQTAVTEKETKYAHIKVAPCSKGSDKVCGTIVALEQPNDEETGKPRTDKNNPKKELRDRPVLGLQTMQGLKPTNTERTTYGGGTIYSTRTGTVYDITNMKLKDGNPDILEVTGGVAQIGITETGEWKRVK